MRPRTWKLGTGVLLFGLIGCGSNTGLAQPDPQPGEVDIGYGAQDKDKVTGAVTSMSGNEIDAGRPLRLEELLRGKLAGVQIITRPDGSQALRIRGSATTPSAGGVDPDPLIVVDGVPVKDGDLSDALAGLTPEDIRQVDVLKDVASTSIYGIRGNAGVIVINTRRR